MPSARMTSWPLPIAAMKNAPATKNTRFKFAASAARKKTLAMHKRLLPLLLASLTFSAQANAADVGKPIVSRVSANEAFVVGGAFDAFADGPRVCAKAITLGVFACGDPALVVEERPEYTDALWFVAPADTKELPLRDGLVRARFDLGKAPDTSLLLRAQVDSKSPEQMTALGLSFEAKKVVVHRWTDGLVREMGVGVREDFRGRSVEVVATLAGPSVVFVVTDASTLAPVATLVVNDDGASTGTVGIRVAKGQSSDGGLQTLSIVNASAAPSKDAASATIAGQRRMVLVEGDSPKGLPADLRSLLVPADDKGALAAVGSPYELARLRRHGVVLKGETADFGYKWLDEQTRLTLDQPIERAEVPDGYLDSKHVEALLQAYEKAFPDLARVIEIGRTHRGRPILALKISDNVGVDEKEPAVLLNGGHHGLELISTTVMLDAIDQILTRYKRRDRSVRRWVNGLEIFVVPLVNPDGADLFLHHTTFGGRKNGRPLDGASDADDPDQGVDLNRNYPFQWGTLDEIGSRSWPAHYRYRGPAAASEPEVKALMTLTRTNAFAASLSYHSWATRILVPYTIPGVKNRRDDEAWAIADALAKQMPRQPSGRRFKARRLLYPVDGTDQDWFRHEIGTLALLVEVALHNPVGAQKESTVAASRNSWRYILERTLRGPTLTVEVVDEDGRPVVARVDVLESRPINGEQWQTREKDGLYHRLLAEPGRYRVRVGDGDAAQTKRVWVGARGGSVRFVVATSNPH